MENQNQVTQLKKEYNNSERQRNIEEEIDLLELFFTLLHSWKAILLSFMIGAVVLGVYHSFLVKPSYQADAKIFITNTDSVINISDLQISAALTNDYAEIIKSRTVLNRVIDELGLNTDYRGLGNMVSVSNPNDTHIIHIMVTCGDLELARNIANTLLNVSIDQIYQIVGTSEPTIIDYARAEAVQDVTPSLRKYMAMGGLLGAVLVCAVLVSLSLMNTTIKTEEDIDKYLGLPVLATVPYYSEIE